MPNVNINISSFAILFLAGSIALTIWFPNNPSTPAFVRALFDWFLAFGVVRWIEKGILYLLPEQDGYVHGDWLWVWYTVSIAAMILVGFLLVAGASSFASALDKLQSVTQ